MGGLFQPVGQFSSSSFGGGPSKFSSFSDLPSSPSGGDNVIYNPDGGGTFPLQYNSGLGKWVCTGTNSFQTVPITKNGSLNTDLFSYSSSGSPGISVSSGQITVSLDQQNTSQEWAGKLKFRFQERVSARMEGDFQGGGSGNDVSARTGVWLGDDFRKHGVFSFLANLAGGHDLWSERHNEDGSIGITYANRGVNNLSSSDSHDVFAHMSHFQFPFSGDWVTQASGSVKTSSGSKEQGKEIEQEEVVPISGGIGGQSDSAYDGTIDFRIRSFEVKV